MFILCVGYTFVSSFTYAACRACNKAPKQLEKYQETMEKIIDLIPVVDDTQLSTGTGKVNQAQRFSVSKALSEQIFTETLPSSIDLVKDPFAENSLAYDDESRRRDREIFIALDTRLIDVVIPMVSGSRHDDAITKEDAQKIDQYLQEIGYMRLAKKDGAFMWLTNQSEAKYRHLASFVRYLNMLHKHWHLQERYTDILGPVGEASLASDAKKTEEAIQQIEKENLGIVGGKIVTDIELYLGKVDITGQRLNYLRFIEFDDNYEKVFTFIRGIEQAYRCSIGLARNQCNTAWQKLRKEVASTFKERVYIDGNSVFASFVDSWGRLKGIFNWGTTEDKAAADERIEHLTDSYWGRHAGDKEAWRDVINTETEYDPVPVHVAGLRKGIRDGWKSESDAVGGEKDKELTSATNLSKDGISKTQIDQKKYTTDETMLQAIRGYGTLDLVEERMKERFRFLGDFNQDDRTDARVQEMQDNFAAIIHLQQDLTQEMVFNDVKRTTRRFPALSAAMYEHMKLIGQKNPQNEDEGGWYTAMGEVCELQCQNLQGKKCWYTKD